MKERVKKLCRDVGMTEAMMQGKVHNPDVVRLACADMIANALFAVSKSIDDYTTMDKYYRDHQR